MGASAPNLSVKKTMKIEIPKEEKKTIEYLGKEYEITPMTLGDMSLVQKKDGSTDASDIQKFLHKRMPEMSSEEIQNIPVSHLKPIVDAIVKVFQMADEKKSTSE